MKNFSAVALHTSRLHLRPLLKTDASALLGIFSNPAVARYLSRPTWPDISHAETRIARDLAGLSEGQYLCLGLFLTKPQSPPGMIGECSLFNFNPNAAVPKSVMPCMPVSGMPDT